MSNPHDLLGHDGLPLSLETVSRVGKCQLVDVNSQCVYTNVLMCRTVTDVMDGEVGQKVSIIWRANVAKER